jgi:hypothetical protein
MVQAGWMVETDGLLTLPNFDRHNGQTAKNRVLTAKRVATYKKGNAGGNAKGNAAIVTSALPKEDKNREDKSIRYTESPEVILAFSSDEYKAAWKKWKQYRANVHEAPVDDYQAQENQRTLDLLGEAGAIDAITYTISNGWKNLQERPTSDNQASQKRYRNKSVNLDIPLTEGAT